MNLDCRSEDEYLPISGIQHFAFCKRQFALIHIEQQWSENWLTFSGRAMHKRSHDPFYFEARGTLLVSRAVPLVSHQLGLSGVADVVEFRQSDNGVAISGREGKWEPYPVEYKRGNVKPDDCDIVQVCAQAMCLEEMLDATISEGAIYYGKIRRRQEVFFHSQIRQRVKDISKQMHYIYGSGITPRAVKTKKCRSCSLLGICLPKATAKSSKAYLRVMSRE